MNGISGLMEENPTGLPHLFCVRGKTVTLKMALTDREGPLILDFQPPNL